MKTELKMMDCRVEGGPPALERTISVNSNRFLAERQPCAANPIAVSRKGRSGEDLAGTGALVFEGEILDLPRWH